MRTELVSIPVYGKDILGDTEIEMSIQCLDCGNLNADMITCKAFQKGIPDKILLGHFDHTRPFKGDNGIRFVR